LEWVRWIDRIITFVQTRPALSPEVRFYGTYRIHIASIGVLSLTRYLCSHYFCLGDDSARQDHFHDSSDTPHMIRFWSDRIHRIHRIHRIRSLSQSPRLVVCMIRIRANRIRRLSANESYFTW